MDLITPIPGVLLGRTRARTKARGQYSFQRPTPFLYALPREIRDEIYHYVRDDSCNTRRKKHRARALTQVSQQTRYEYRPIYLKNVFQHKYTSNTALKKFLRLFTTTFYKASKIKIVVIFKWLYSTLDFLPIFKLIDSTCGKRLEVSFRCEHNPPTIADNMNQAIQQKALWQGSTSQVQGIKLAKHNDMHLTVDLACGPCSKQAREERDNAAIVWSSLGFKVKPHHI